MLGTKVLEEKKSKFNDGIKVVKTFGLGTYIQVGGLTQSGGIVESIWRSTLKNYKRENFKKILILGLGGGTLVKLIKKFWPDSEIDGVDIDKVIVELGQKHLGLKDVNIKISDAMMFLNKAKNKKYDLILVDLYQGDLFPDKFEKEIFFARLKRNLNQSGKIIFNRLYYGDKRPNAVRFGLKLKKNFSKVDYFYPEANIMFICKN